MSVTEKRGLILKGAGPVYTGIDTARISVTTGATEIITFGQARGELLLTNLSTDVIIFVSESTAVTTASGYPILPQQPYQWAYAGPLYGMVQTTTSPLAVGELKS